ncbi:MAG: YebC/PmpR family DNA-binding transcriptional regulator [Myxococcota bacterium]
MGRAFANRIGSMMARWDRMAKAFTRVGKDIAIAVKAGGPNPDANPALRRAIQNGRAVNMPKDKIDSAIKRAAGNDAEHYDEIVYEGYAPHGIAVMVETATNNPTRTVANVRMHFNKKNGTLGNSGSVSYLFKKMGVIKIARAGVDRDTLELELIDHGLEDFLEDESDKGPIYVLRSAFNDFGALQRGVEERGVTPISAETEWVPLTTIELGEEETTAVLELVDRLEQDEDVQRVFVNLA